MNRDIKRATFNSVSTLFDTVFFGNDLCGGDQCKHYEPAGKQFQWTNKNYTIMLRTYDKILDNHTRTLLAQYAREIQ